MLQRAAGWSPVYVTQEAALGGGGGDEMADDDVELGVMSIGFMLPKEDDAVIWRGPRKNGLIKQFLTDVEWGALDYLLVDTPPGTSDEHISLVQYLAKALGPDDGALIVSTPQNGPGPGEGEFKVPVMAGLERLANFLLQQVVPSYDFAGAASKLDCETQIPDVTIPTTAIHYNTSDLTYNENLLKHMCAEPVRNAK